MLESWHQAEISVAWNMCPILSIDRRRLHAATSQKESGHVSPDHIAAVEMSADIQSFGLPETCLPVATKTGCSGKGLPDLRWRLSCIAKSVHIT